MWSVAVALLGLVLGPGLIVASIKSMRSGEGVYDSGSRSYMAVVNWGVILLGLVITGASIRFLYQTVSSLI